MVNFVGCCKLAFKLNIIVRHNCAAQGIDFRRKILGPEAKMGQGTAPAYAVIRQQIAFIERDEVMYPHIETMRKLLADGRLTAHLQ